MMEPDMQFASQHTFGHHSKEFLPDVNTAEGRLVIDKKSSNIRLSITRLQPEAENVPAKQMKPQTDKLAKVTEEGVLNLITCSVDSSIAPKTITSSTGE